jgi:tRNA-splicing ligase RtcB (3'-phosphate/5'-hydroxy nucleic acid ligase)
VTSVTRPGGAGEGATIDISVARRRPIGLGDVFIEDEEGSGVKHRFGNVISWATDIEDGTIEQAQKAAALPFVRGRLALMPDAHVGMGATIGSVIPTEGAVIPSAVGVDIGCGMIAVECPFDAGLLPDDTDRLLGYIGAVVPAGVGRGHDSARDIGALVAQAPTLTQKEEATAKNQLGSLGSGNHFVEVCLDERDRVWVVLHSGSRGVGNQIAKRHIAAAKGLMKQYFIELDDPDLAYLVEGTPEFDEYIAGMLWAQDYALANREVMMDAVLLQLQAFIGHDFVESQRINCHHNFCVREHHHGRDLWITRKGAIRARVGDLGVIPGSMGTASYIVEGLGNPASYESCSHGAGRRMSRSQARRQLDLDTFIEEMDGKSWLHDQAAALLDEDPRSYKDIDQVMEDQQDLTTVTHKLHQILNYKGL